MPRLPRHPLLLARLGLNGFPSAKFLVRRFREERTKALFAGLAAHSFLSLDQPLTAAFGLLLGAAAHAVGWPIPRTGSQAITNALCGLPAKLGGTIIISQPIVSLEALPGYDFILCDVTPRQLLQLANERSSPGYSRQLATYRYGAAVV